MKQGADRAALVDRKDTGLPMIDAYQEFLARKRIVDPMTGIAEIGMPLPSALKPHQHDITSWALRRGRAAIFAGTGLGKTLMELTWGTRVAAHTGKQVLAFAPLAVSVQHLREAEKFGMIASAREEKDEQHISPLQLDVIERCIDLWSNPNDVVLTPFLGIGSEVYSAVKMGRRGVGFELKPSYFQQAARNIAALENKRGENNLISMMEASK